MCCPVLIDMSEKDVNELRWEQEELDTGADRDFHKDLLAPTSRKLQECGTVLRLEFY